MVSPRSLSLSLLLCTALNVIPAHAGDGPRSLDDIDQYLRDSRYAEKRGFFLVNAYPAEADQVSPARKQEMAQEIADAFREQNENPVAPAATSVSDQPGSLLDGSSVDDFDFVSGDVVTASGERFQHSDLSDKAEADALYAKNVAIYYKKPGVVLRGVAGGFVSTVTPGVKYAGSGFAGWVGIPAFKAAVSQKLAESVATPMIDVTGKIIASGLAFAVGQAPAAAFYGGWWGLNHAIGCIPLGSTMKQLVVGQMVIKPFLDPAWSVVKTVAPKLPGAAKSTASGVYSTYTWLKNLSPSSAAKTAAVADTAI